MALNEILNDTVKYLEYLKEEGISVVEVDRAILTELGRSPSKGKSPVSAGTFDDLSAEIAACTKCELHSSRTNTVPGQGNTTPEIMFVGEAPGADEDLQGLAFVGRAGQLLTKMIQAMGYSREDVFIGNILKCRPPENRKPLPGEMETCRPYLKRQIEVLKPKVIIALGATAVQGLVANDISISKLRGTWLSFEGIRLMPTFHPAYLLRNPSAKKFVWEDLKEVLRFLGKEPTPVTSRS